MVQSAADLPHTCTESKVDMCFQTSYARLVLQQQCSLVLSLQHCKRTCVMLCNQAPVFLLTVMPDAHA